MALTKKMALFIGARKRRSTNTNAAIKAGYSEKTAAAAGSRLAKHPMVIAALAASKLTARQRKARKKIEEAFRDAPGPAADQPATPPAAALDPAPIFDNPKDFLKSVMNDPKADLRQRVAAAKALLPTEGRRLTPLGKKELQQGAANKVASAGRFTPGAPPRLVASSTR